MDTPKKPKNYVITSDAQSVLESGRCPFCEADFERYFLFGESDGREGGFADCLHCALSFAWIDFPFECEVSPLSLEASVVDPYPAPRGRDPENLHHSLAKAGVVASSGDCPECGASLHIDTGSILDFEDGLTDGPVLFCTNCGYDSSPLPPRA